MSADIRLAPFALADAYFATEVTGGRSGAREEQSPQNARHAGGRHQPNYRGVYPPELTTPAALVKGFTGLWTVENVKSCISFQKPPGKILAGAKLSDPGDVDHRKSAPKALAKWRRQRSCEVRIDVLLPASPRGFFSRRSRR